MQFPIHLVARTLRLILDHHRFDIGIRHHLRATAVRLTSYPHPLIVQFFALPGDRSGLSLFIGPDALAGLRGRDYRSLLQPLPCPSILALAGGDGLPDDPAWHSLAKDAGCRSSLHPAAVALRPDGSLRALGEGEVVDLFRVLRTVLAAHEERRLRPEAVPPEGPACLQVFEVLPFQVEQLVRPRHELLPARALEPTPLQLLAALPRTPIKVKVGFHGDGRRATLSVTANRDHWLLFGECIEGSDQVGTAINALVQACRGGNSDQRPGLPAAVVCDAPALCGWLQEICAALDIPCTCHRGHDEAAADAAAARTVVEGPPILPEPVMPPAVGDLVEYLKNLVAYREGDDDDEDVGGGPIADAEEEALAEEAEDERAWRRYRRFDAIERTTVDVTLSERSAPRLRFFGEDTEPDAFGIGCERAFNAWWLLRRSASGRPCLAERLLRRCDRHSAEYLRGLLAARPGIFQVEDRGQGLSLRPWRGGRSVDRVDGTFGQGLRPGQFVIGMLGRLGGRRWVWLLAPALGPEDLAPALAFLARLGLRPTAPGLRANLHLPGRLWAWLEERQRRKVTFMPPRSWLRRGHQTRYEFDPGVLAGLEGCDLVRDPGGRGWLWLRREALGAVVRARLRAVSGGVVATSGSFMELVHLRMWLQDVAAIRMRDTSIRVEPASRDRPRPPGPVDAGEQRDELARRRLRRWLDEPLRELDGATPRQAAASRAARKGLRVLLQKAVLRRLGGPPQLAAELLRELRL